MNRYFFPAILGFGATLWQTSAHAQPTTKPAGKTVVPTFSIVELETYLGGRTSLTVDLKDATLEEVAAALSRSSGQKISVYDTRPPRTVRIAPRVEGLPAQGLPAQGLPAQGLPAQGLPAQGLLAPQVMPAAPAASGPLYNLAAANTPFWETLRGWQLSARAAAEKARALDSSKPPLSNWNVPNSVGLQKAGAGFMLQTNNTLADGRAVSAWPFLLVATDLRRTQEARLNETGLREIESNPDPLERPWNGKTPLAETPAAPEKPAPAIATPPIPAPEEKRWSDRLVLTTFVLPDPKLTPTGLRCEVLEAVDEKGNDLRLKGDAGRDSGDSYQDMGSGSPLRISLSSGPEMGKRLVRLRGVLRFNVVTRITHWETTQLQTPVEDTLNLEGGEFKVKFNGVKEEANGWTAHFDAQSRGAHLERFWNSRVQSSRNGGASQRGTAILDFQGVPEMRLVDGNGRPLFSNFGSHSFGLSYKNPETNATVTSSTPLDVSPLPLDVAQNWAYMEALQQTFGGSPLGFNGQLPGGQPAPGRPAKLIVDFPVERREVVVPFEFTNLPLPPK